MSSLDIITVYTAITNHTHSATTFQDYVGFYKIRGMKLKRPRYLIVHHVGVNFLNLGLADKQGMNRSAENSMVILRGKGVGTRIPTSHPCRQPIPVF